MIKSNTNNLGMMMTDVHATVGMTEETGIAVIVMEIGIVGIGLEGPHLCLK